MCPHCGQAAPLVYRGVLAYCSACGQLRGPLTGGSVNHAGSLSKAGGTVAKVFGWLARVGGMEEREMLRTFNCGVGMVCVIAAAEADALLAHLYEQGERPALIGRITEAGAEPVTFQGRLSL